MKRTLYYFIILSVLIPVNILFSQKYYLNNKYFIYEINENSLSIFDFENMSSKIKIFPFCFDYIEICRSSNYLSITYFTDTTKLRKNNLIYAIDIDSIFSIGEDLGEQVNRWSTSGSYTYINKEYYFILLPTQKLKDFLDRNLADDQLIKIYGHPLSAIFGKMWVGENIIYFTGIDEVEYWGLFNLSNMKNYFLGFCNRLENNSNCNIFQTLDSTNVIKLINTINVFDTISTDFYKDIKKRVK